MFDDLDPFRSDNVLTHPSARATKEDSLGMSVYDLRYGQARRELDTMDERKPWDTWLETLL